MRKLFLSMAAVAALLTSCSKDETTTAPVIERSKVTFTVNAPELSTRAEDDYGTGLTAKTLDYVIYDLAEEAGKNQITGTITFPDGKLETTVTVDLVEGREYEAIFFAHAPESPYTFNKTEQTMTINTTSLKANAESYDAFYKYVEPFVMPATGLTKDVEMTRPFAQLNVATNDFDTQAGAMIDAKTTGIEVEAYNTLNFKDGTVDGKETIIYALADKMTGEITANDGKEYDWLTMNYILVNTKENVGVKFLFTDEPNNDEQNPLVREYSAVPVQRNHKTNIIGLILTNKTTFNVEILPGFEDPEHDYNVDTTEETVVTTVDELQAAIDNAIAGTNIIKLGKDITTGTQPSRAADAIMIPQTEGTNIVIDGDGHTYNGTIYIDGNSRSTGTETLTFTNINFKHSTGDIDFISGNNQAEAYRYPHNVTIENCTFTGNTNGAVVGARFRQGYNINIVNCTAKDVFLLLWATGGKGITVDGADVIVGDTGEGGLSFGTSTYIVVKNSTITNNNPTGYGVRVADNSTANNINITLENNTIKANYPVVARFMNVTNANDKSDCKDNVNMTFNGVNTLNATNANGYQVVFTHDNDNAPLVEPEDATITLTGADSYNVFPRDLVIATAAELKAFRNAVNEGNSYKDKVVKLAADINLGGEEWTPIGGDDSYVNNFAGTFDGNGFTVSNFKFNGKCAGFFGTISGGANIKNLTIDGATLSGPHYAGGIVAWAEAGATILTIENCHVKNSIITLTAEELSNGKYDNGDKAGGIIGFSYKNAIIGCSVENTTITAYRDCGGIVGYAEGGTVKNNTVKDGVKLIQNNDNNYKGYTTEEAFNFGDIVGRRAGDILEGGNSGTVTKQGGIFDGYYITTEDGVETLNVFNITGIEKALEAAGAAGAGNTNVNLAKGEYDMTDVDWAPIKVDGYNGADIVTFEGNGSVIKGLTDALFHGGFAGGSGIVIKNLTIEGANMVNDSEETGYGAFICYVDSMDKIMLENCHLKKSTITSTNDARVGGLIGYTTGYDNTNDGAVKTHVTIKNCSVIDCKISAGNSASAINGHAGANAWTYTTIENCVATGNTLKSTDSDKWRVGVVVGTANVGEVTINNITESGNTLEQTDKTAPEGDAKRHYYGRFVPGTTGKLTIDGVAVSAE